MIHCHLVSCQLAPCILDPNLTWKQSDENGLFMESLEMAIPVQPDIWMDQTQQIQSGIQQNKPRWAEGSRGRKKWPVCI